MTNVVTPPTMMSSDALVVMLNRQADLMQASKMERGGDRKQAAWDKLVATADQTQGPVVALVDQMVADGRVSSYERLVSPNALVVDPKSSTSAVIEALAGSKLVKAIYDNRGNARFENGELVDVKHGAGLVAGPHTGLDLFSVGAEFDAARVGTPYGIELVGAPEANAVGADGTGKVYGSIDTGADHTHEALAAKYRGNDGAGSVVHDYSWFDFGAGRSPSPVDGHGHGTHTIGTVVGGTPEQQIGVAPKGQWIAVAGLKGGLDVRLKSLQFMQAPTRVDGTQPDPRKAPDVVGMSWWTGPSTSTAFGQSIANLVAAGIEPVKSMGNNGPNPETGSAPGQFEDIHSIAAVGPDSQVAKFSSRGPSALPHTGKTPGWKPDFAAPGVKTVSAVPGNRYKEMSGTSMAQPHFSGVLMALLTKFPKLTSRELDQVLAKSSTDVGATGRDLEFGHGIVNIPRALEVAAAEFPHAAA